MRNKMEEETCPLAIVENIRKAKILEDLLTQIELEEKYPGYHDSDYVGSYDVSEFLAEGRNE